MTAGAERPTRGLAPGSRVVLRCRLEAPDPSTGATLTDVVGDLVAADEDSLTLDTRQGRRVVARASVVLAKVVPPRPSRRGAPHRALSVADLERVKVDAWPAPERGRLGDWLLRAGGGLTHRANSALAVGSPGVPVSEAADRVTGWYVERGLCPDLALPGPTGFAPDADPVGAELVHRGWTVAIRSVAMTAAVAEVRTALAALAGPADGIRIDVGTEPPPEWLALFTARRGGDPALARSIVLGSPAQWFATAFEDGSAVARARLALAGGWTGLSAVEVVPSHRRRGLARRMLAALLPAAGDTRSIHLDVETDNHPARALYRSVGFEDHHEYVNLVAPERV
jgi:GNAT superfamily N-acetyltransferase